MVRNLRRQWLPDASEKETQLKPWRLPIALLGSCCFMWLAVSRVIPRSDVSVVGITRPNVEAFVNPLDPTTAAALLVPAIMFGFLILYQKGRGGPVSVFLGGVGLPALTFWIIGTAL